MLIIFQILFILFALFTVFGVWKRKRDGQISARAAWFWSLFWAAAIVAVLWPESTTLLANQLGIGRGADLIIYISIAVIFYLLFRLHIKIESINRDITKVVRKEALEDNHNS